MVGKWTRVPRKQINDSRNSRYLFEDMYSNSNSDYL